MSRSNAVLIGSGSVSAGTFAGSTVAETVLFNGGRAVLVISANQYGGGLFLATQSGNGTWVNVNGTTYSANQVTAYDLPAGPYRMVNNIGSSLNVCAILAPVSYSR